MSDFICEHCGISKAECTCSAVKICKCCENHVMKKLNNLAKSQIDIPADFAKVINGNFEEIK